MIKSGLVSVSFRKLSPDEIIAAAVKAGLKGIEWGGDVHVPHGDLARAAAVLAACRREKVEISAYGSYYRAGLPTGNDNLDFSQVLDTARALETSTVRVWAGHHGSAGQSPEQRQEGVDDLKRICDLAGAHNVSISLEYHSNTLTDTNASASQLIQEVNHDNLRFYWQPPLGTNREYRLEGLRGILPRLTNLHVFWWHTEHDTTCRLSLEEGMVFWNEVFAVAGHAGGTHFAAMEFFRGDELDQFYADAAVLRRLLKEE